jgi:hypothetical protein
MTLKSIIYIICFIASLTLGKRFSDELQINPVVHNSYPTIFRLKSIADITAKLIVEHNNVFVIDDNTIVVHSKMLNTLERTIGNYASLFGQQADDSWYQIEPLGKVTSVYGPSEPISPKLNVKNGDGGYVSIKISKMYGKALSLDFPHIIDMFPIYGGAIGFNSKHTNMFSVTGTYQCTAARGEVVQVVSRIHYNRYPGYKVREVIPVVGKVFKYFDKVDLQLLDWKTNDEPVMVVNSQKRPDLQCVEINQ